MATRITTNDITDSMVKPIVEKDHSYLTRADERLVSVAKKKGLLESDISTPISYEVKEWLIKEICLAVCTDKAGINPKKLFEQGVDYDPYEVKRKFFYPEALSLRSSITKEMLEDEADSPGEFASSGIELYRG